MTGTKIWSGLCSRFNGGPQHLPHLCLEIEVEATSSHGCQVKKVHLQCMSFARDFLTDLNILGTSIPKRLQWQVPLSDLNYIQAVR